MTTPTVREPPPPYQVSGGVWAVPVIIPDNPLGFTLVYLLESAAGPVLIDAGWDHDRSWAALTDGIAATGHDVTDVAGVLVTHAHPDHHGLSGRVREASGAWVALHPLDAQMVTEQRNTHGSWLATMGAAFLAAGADETAFADMPAPDSPSPVAPPVLPDRLIADGELMDVPGRRVRALWTPGHSPGHTCFVLEDTGSILTGDHLLPRISPHIGLWSPADTDRDPLGQFLASLEALVLAADERGITVALPAHVGTVEDLRARAEEIRDHHLERCDELRALLAGGPLTAWQIAEGLSWKYGWDSLPVMMRRVALAETQAHLRHLERKGTVEELPGPRPRSYRLT